LSVQAPPSVEDALPGPAASVDANAERRRRLVREWLPLALVVLVGALLRLWDLDGLSLWNDELSSWWRSSGPLSEIWQRIVADVHPAGYYLLLHVWQLVFGDSEALLRLPSAIAGIATLLVVYRWGTFIAGPNMALVATALAAVAPALVTRSQSARPYALLVLCLTLAGYYFHRNLRAILADERSRFVFQLGIWTAVSAHVHYSGFVWVVVGWCLLFTVVLIQRRGYRVLWGLLLAVLLYAPWLPWLIADLSRGGLGGAERLPLTALFPPLRVFPSNLISIALFLVVPLACAGVAWRGMPPGQRRALVDPAFLLLWAFLPIVAAFVKSNLSRSIWTLRNLVPAQTPLLLLFAWSLTHLPLPAALRKNRWFYRGAFVAGSVLFVHLALTAFRGRVRYTPERQNFRGIVGWVLENAERAPRAPVVSYGWQAAYFNYYFIHHNSSRRVKVNARTPRELFDALRRETTRSERVWLVAGHKELSARMRKSLGRDFVIEAQRAFEGGSAHLVKAKNFAPHGKRKR
jgi:uncharacterized membrane protein